jgi:hypothetical protein
VRPTRAIRDSGLRRVLFVQYLYYPRFNVAVKQTAKLCKYLPMFGWEPVILTKDWATEYAPEDAALGTRSAAPSARPVA